MVPKGKLIEQIAQLIADKKLPILEDVRDEATSRSARARAQEPQRRSRTAQGIAVSADRSGNRFGPQPQRARCAAHTPGVMGLKLLLQEWVISQIDILLRRASTGWTRSPARLELLEGYIIAYLNLDRIIEIIRTEDEPKPVMMAEFGLTDRQAEAILNMRLRQFAQA
jgi:topoisomerase-4 subunit A